MWHRSHGECLYLDVLTPSLGHLGHGRSAFTCPKAFQLVGIFRSRISPEGCVCNGRVKKPLFLFFVCLLDWLFSINQMKTSIKLESPLHYLWSGQDLAGGWPGEVAQLQVSLYSNIHSWWRRRVGLWAGGTTVRPCHEPLTSPNTSARASIGPATYRNVRVRSGR